MNRAVKHSERNPLFPTHDFGVVDWCREDLDIRNGTWNINEIIT